MVIIILMSLFSNDFIDKFLFKELSHFHILSVPVILFSIVNLKETISKN